MSKHLGLISLLAGFAWLSAPLVSDAAPAWYGGTIEFIQPYSGGIGVKLDGTVLDDCQHQRVWVKDSVLGEKAVDRIYSMVLAAQAAGRRVEIVIDKSVNGPGGECVAMGNTKIRT